MANNLVKQIRSGRKVFKLLKFVEVYKEFVYLASDFKIDEFKTTLKSILFEQKFGENGLHILDNSLKLVIKFSAFFYYLLDNMLWVVNIGVISNQIVKRGFMKRCKDIFGLIMNYFQIMRSIVAYKRVS